MKKRIISIVLSLVVVLSFLTVNGFDSSASIGSWKSDSYGWWYDLDGTYARGWREIDGKWYYFLSDGYMDYSEYRDGCWLDADGSWNTAYTGGHWCCDSTGWWYADNSGWYPVSTWLWIDGVNYYFDASGYMADSSGSSNSSSGSASGSGNSGSSNVHQHTWVCTKDAWDEQVLVKDAWDEKVPIYTKVSKCFCCDCGAEITGAGACPVCGNFDAYYDTVTEITGYDTVHHDAEYKTVHHDAEYTCSTCGAKK